MHRIVHLDLKGAPLKIPYLERVLLLMKSWGATGILIEWEDTFPYTGMLEDIGSIKNSGGDGMYSINEVTHILKFAKENGLEVIQLVQTMGHMEYVLKHPIFRNCRELQRSPSVLCPTNMESQMLVRSMIQQILNVQPDANYLHIGADEVWYTAKCQACLARASNTQYKQHALVLDHIQQLASWVKQVKPGLKVLIWDDMLRTISVEFVKAFGLGELVQPVVWHYQPIEAFNIDPNLWLNYKSVFPQVWVASAFKGANGSSQLTSPVARYVSNQEAWLKEIKNVGREVNFAGIILTGWSRYDHYATLCELMPVSLPSLASCLKMVHNPENLPKDSLVSDVLPSESWPGEHLARSVHSFCALRERVHTTINCDLVQTWLNPWQLERQYTSPIQVEGIVGVTQQLLQELMSVQCDISSGLKAVTGARSTEEWVHTNITPLFNKVTQLLQAADTRARSDPSVTPV